MLNEKAYKQILILCALYSLWTVENGIYGETCENKNTNSSSQELWCRHADIPDCVDRTIKCSSPPVVYDGDETKLTWYKPPENKLNEMPEMNNEYGTKIDYQCTSRRHSFDYAVPEGLSFYYTQNVDSMSVTCTKDG